MAFQSVPTHLGGITIWNHCSNKTDANLEDSACTVRVLLFFPIQQKEINRAADRADREAAIVTAIILAANQSVSCFVFN